MRVLVLDNYDSFTYNLVQYLGELGTDPDVVRNDRATVEELLARGAARLIVSPGPCTPDEAGTSVGAIRRFAEAGVPVLGVCLGHQGIGIAFGGSVVRAAQVMHGKVSVVQHDERGVFRGVSQPFTAGRYHSLVVADPLPDVLEAAARTGDGTIMGVRHRQFPIHGVQFHPESVLTGEGRQLLRNFLEL